MTQRIKKRLLMRLSYFVDIAGRFGCSANQRIRSTLADGSYWIYTSLFNHADLQIQLHTPASVTAQDAPAAALHDSDASAYRTKPAKKTGRPGRKSKTATA